MLLCFFFCLNLQHAELVRSQLQKQIDVVVKDLALEQHRTKLLLADVERLQQERKTMSEEIAHKVRSSCAEFRT